MVILEHRALAERGAELVELRLDWLSRTPDVGRLLKDRPTPVIVTCRRQQDKGRWKFSEEQRLTLIRAAIVEGAEYIDLEEDIAAKIPRYGETKRIISHHDFDRTPDKLEEIHKRMTELDPDIIKLATMANSPADIVRMLQLVDKSEIPTIGFCMGELGIASRVLCGKYGAPFTYTTFSQERELAPGQLSFDEMRNVYRYDSINQDTQVYGVLGDPIAHSFSPLVHNRAFRETGLNCVYLPFRVPKDSLSDTLEKFNWLGIRGYSVTIPHKETVLRAVKDPPESVTEIGAANTIYRDRLNRWRAANTDREAALTSLRLELPDGANGNNRLAGKQVLLLGAGGAARAVALGVMREGAALTIANRSHDRAVKLAQEIGCQQVTWENRGAVFADVLINCTSVGMHPHVDETPFPGHWIREGMLVFDSIYNPENTLLIKDAKARGCPIVTGVEMFVRQAAAQFEYFTDQTAPVEQMQEAFRQGISAVG